jgi:hypothetical protein
MKENHFAIDIDGITTGSIEASDLAKHRLLKRVL